MKANTLVTKYLEAGNKVIDLDNEKVRAIALGKPTARINKSLDSWEKKELELYNLIDKCPEAIAKYEERTFCEWDG